MNILKKIFGESQIEEVNIEKKDRHYYYQELEKSDDLFNNKEWLKEAMLCTLNYHNGWDVKPESVQKILDNNKFSKQDYLDFISMKNNKIAADLRSLEGIND